MGVVHAYRMRGDPEALTTMLRAACHDLSPTDVMIALASLVTALAQIAERRVQANVLDSQSVLALAHNLAVSEGPLAASAVGCSADDLIAGLSGAVALNTPR